MDDIKLQLNTLRDRLNTLLPRINLHDKEVQIRELEALTIKDGFWDDPQEASKTMQQLSILQQQLKDIGAMQSEIEDSFTMLELLQEEDSQKREEEQKNLPNTIRRINKQIDALELELFLSGRFDKSDAILSVHAGQGGTEAQDWTEMLARMYQRYFERKGWKFDVSEISPGDEAGYKSITIYVYGLYSYGYLKNEIGTHRLVRQSPFNADNLRQVLPQIEDLPDIVIREEDVQWDFFRAGGHGGQNVNKVSTAVRLRHIPSGIIITSQNERYQGQNRENALKMLRTQTTPSAAVRPAFLAAFMPLDLRSSSMASSMK